MSLTKVSAGVLNIDDLYGFRNRIINGDMRIDQRNEGAAVTTDGSYVVDRFLCNEDTDGSFSAQQDSTAPTGFVNSIKWTVTSDDSSLGATQYASIRHIIEGFNVADLGFGTASAKTITLSFWVRSSVTGTFGGSFVNIDFSRSYPYTYTILSADTWEYKTVTIAGDTTGTWATNNGIGLRVYFCLAAGADRAGTAGSWSGGVYVGATGQTNLMATNGATFYITGVQLEVGSVATPFERRPYGTELALCQRYFFNFPDLTGLQLEAYTTTVLQTTVYFPVPMRTNPTIATISSDRIGLGGVSNITTTLTSGTISYRINTGGSQQATIRFTSSASLTAGLSYIIFPNAVDSGASFSAEL